MSCLRGRLVTVGFPFVGIVLAFIFGLELESNH